MESLIHWARCKQDAKQEPIDSIFDFDKFDFDFESKSNLKIKIDIEIEIDIGSGRSGVVAHGRALQQQRIPAVTAAAAAFQSLA